MPAVQYSVLQGKEHALLEEQNLAELTILTFLDFRFSNLLGLLNCLTYFLWELEAPAQGYVPTACCGGNI